MKFKSVQKKIERSPEDLARIKQLREQYQRERPSLEDLCAAQGVEPVTLGAYLEAKQLFHRLRQERERAGLSLSDVADRSGMDKAAISRLENGHQPNPTLDTVARYAAAIGKQVVWGIVDAPESPNANVRPA